MSAKTIAIKARPNIRLVKVIVIGAVENRTVSDAGQPRHAHGLQSARSGATARASVAKQKGGNERARLSCHVLNLPPLLIVLIVGRGGQTMESNRRWQTDLVPE